MANIITGRVLIHDAQQPDKTNKTVLEGVWSVLNEPDYNGSDINTQTGAVRRIMRQEVDYKGEGATYSAEDFNF